MMTNGLGDLNEFVWGSQIRVGGKKIFDRWKFKFLTVGNSNFQISTNTVLNSPLPNVYEYMWVYMFISYRS